MLTFCLFWIIFSLIFSTPGSLLLHFTDSIEIFDRSTDRFVVSTWAGILALAYVLHTFSIFTAITPMHGLVLTAVLVSGSWIFLLPRRKSFRKLLDRSDLQLLLALILIVSFWMSFQRTILFDSSDSHFDSIRWTATYGAVYGLGLLISPLGYGSSWYSLQAPLTLPGLDGRYGVILNAFVFVIFLFHFISCFRSVVKSQGRVQDWFILFASPIVFLPLRTDLLSSPSADIPVNFLIVLVCWSFLAIAGSKKGRFLPLLISVGALAIKLNTAPLFIGSLLFYAFDETKKAKLNWKRIFSAGITTAVLGIPIMAVNFILSGCPAYPSPLFCTNLPWSVGTETVIRQAGFLRDFGRWSDWDNLKKSHEGFWLWPWIIREKKLALMIVLSLISGAGLWFQSRKKHSDTSTGGFHLLSTGLIGIIFLMALSPCLRYGWGYTAVIPALALANFCWKRVRLHIGYYAVILILFTALTIQYTRFGSLTHFRNAIRHGDLTLEPADLAPSFVLPPKLIPISTFAYSTSPTGIGYSAKMEVYDRAKINDFEFNRPKYGRCWDVAVPCIRGVFSEDPFENVFLLSPERGVAGGFRSSVRSH